MGEIYEKHNELVSLLSQQIKTLHRRGKKVQIFHGSTNSTRPQNFDSNETIDVSGLKQVLSVNSEGLFAVVEPNVPFDIFVREILKYGLIPEVVPEFPGITIGGAVQGGSGESSSFKYGLVHDTCIEFELILGNGEVVLVSRLNHPNLFWASVCSYGTLGVVTMLKIRLMKAKKYVKVTYLPTASNEETLMLIKEKSLAEIEYLDGIIISRTSGLVMTGVLSDDENLPVARFRKAYQPWFYLHAKEIRTKNQRYEELIPIEDYFFRYDRGAFWVGIFGFGILHVPNIWLTRFIFNWLFTTRTLYRFLHATNASAQYFAQDICVPIEKTSEFIARTDQILGAYPLWLCPVRPGTKDRLSPACLLSNLVINVGIWTKYQVDSPKFINTNRKFEQITSELGGRKVLYAHSYYTEEEFWMVYERGWYDGARKEFQADESFPSIFDKVIVRKAIKASRVTGLIGLLRSPYRIK
ncbi:MAG: FAD-binding oxidoreductase [bacterium]|nr:FAD-binding oxidoreductase [bacterium]